MYVYCFCHFHHTQWEKISYSAVVAFYCLFHHVLYIESKLYYCQILGAYWKTNNTLNSDWVHKNLRGQQQLIQIIAVYLVIIVSAYLTNDALAS